MNDKRADSMKSRVVWIFCILVALYLLLVGKLVEVQVVRAGAYSEWGDEWREVRIPIPATRGRILDRNGRGLAVNIESATLVSDNKQVKDPQKTAQTLAAVTGLDKATLLRKLTGRSRYPVLGEQVNFYAAQKLRSMLRELPGVSVKRDSRRAYPIENLAAQVLGFTNRKNQGLEGSWGLERDFNKWLAGENGEIRADMDRQGHVISETRRTVSDAKDGYDVYLTIDVNIQYAAERALARMAKLYTPQSACAIVLDPHTGEILALANYPECPRSASRGDLEKWRNQALSLVYEPGSTIKPFTIAAALSAGMSPSAKVTYCKGREPFGKYHLTCSLHPPYMNGHGAVDMPMVIRQSCNIGAGHLALKMGGKKLYDMHRAFGLQTRPGTGMGTEEKGIKSSLGEWRGIRLANIGFGQGVAVTPMQMAGAYATLANDGNYLRPHILREVRTIDNKPVSSYVGDAPRPVVTPQVAAKVAQMLVGCVEEGTGKTGKVPGRTTAAKTGSAEVASSTRRGFEAGVFIASFMGFVPAYEPKLVIAVVVRRPQGSHWGATVAAPVFREIGEKALWYMNVPLDDPDDPKLKQEQQNGGLSPT